VKVVCKDEKMGFQPFKLSCLSLAILSLIAIPSESCSAQVLPLAYQNQYVIAPIRQQSLTLHKQTAELARLESGFDRRGFGGGVSTSTRVFDTIGLADEEQTHFDCQQLLRSRGIINSEGWHCEPNYLLSVEAIPHDPLFESQAPLSQIELPKAWDLTTGSSQITVAILDTGIDYTHEDLELNMWKNTQEIPDNGLDDDENGFIDDVYGIDTYNNDSDPMDDNNHGTHCAGIVGAVSNNASGMSGINWNVRLMALKFIGANGSGSIFDAIRALEYGVENGAHIINASFGTSYPSVLLRNAIEQAGEQGVLFAAASGNSARNIDTSPTYPASYDLKNIISVGSSDEDNNLSWFSNYGAIGVDIVAPGERILSTVRNGGYKKFSGTSMATPHVSGVAALLLSYKPHLSFTDLKSEILDTAAYAPSLQGLVRTAGILSAYRALYGIREESPIAEEPSSAPVYQPARISRIRHTARRTRVASLNGGRLRFVVRGTARQDIELSYTLSTPKKEVTCPTFAVALNSKGRRRLTLRLPRRIKAKRLAIRSPQASNERAIRLKHFYPSKHIALVRAPEISESCQALPHRTRIH